MLFGACVESVETSPLALQSPAQPDLHFAELGELVEATGESLRHLGLSPRDCVAVALPQGPENLTLCLSVMTVACAVPINPNSTSRKIVELLQALNPALLVCAPHATHLQQQASAAKIPCATLDHQVHHPAGQFALSLPPRPIPPQETGIPTEVALVLHTSGSTARPKAVPITRDMLLNSAANLADSLALGEDDICLNMLPQFHIGALLDLFIAPLLAGGRVVVCRDNNAAVFFECLTAYAPTWYQGVPTMLADLVDQAKSRDMSALPRLRFCRSVSATLPDHTRRQFETLFNCPVIEIYGMTETCGVICSSPLPPAERKAGSVGPCIAGEVIIADDAGNPARAGLRGEVLVKGQSVFGGYLGQAKQPHFIGDWFRTGDQGYLDEQGYLFLTGRIKELINRGGEKIAPLEIDQALLAYPGVSDAASFALPHPSLGEEPAASIVCQSPSLNLQDLQAYLKAQLSSYKVPRKLFVVSHLPRTPSGKLQRHLLSQQFSTGDGPTEQQKRYPETALAKLIAQQWQALLGVEDIGLEDDFFDLGGDSLKATTFVEQLEEALNIRLDAGLLFDEPTIAALESWVSREVLTGLAPEQYQSAHILPDVYQEVRRTTDTWPGSRPNPASLLVAFNSLGQNTPLFWGCQNMESLANLANALGPEQPVFGFRTLHKLKSKSPTNSEALARHYTEEIRRLAGNQDYFLGGFCEGGRIAFKVASQLSQDGISPLSLIMVNHWTPAPYQKRIALAFSRDSKHSPYRYFTHPEQGWRKFYSGTLSTQVLEAGHLEMFNEAHVEVIAATIANELSLAARGSEPSGQVEVPIATPLPADSYQATVSTRVATFAQPNSTTMVAITLKNSSQQTWPASGDGGPVLNCRWRSPFSGKIRVWRGKPMALPQALAPGEQLTLQYLAETPARFGPWQLEVDLVDEGICWFGDQGSQPGQHNIFLSPAAAVLNALAEPLRWLHQIFGRTNHAAS